ncbi:MAG TPA: glycoside hydrolase family 88 protein [Terracidiphilus sp.]|nr:glycoside hydrolase family 88 protein [Terracidiphilus sp.]
MKMRWLCMRLGGAGSTAVLLGVLMAVLLGTSSVACIAQQPANTAPVASPGDQPDNPGPLATDLSPALHSKQIRAAMRKVADWELGRVDAQPPSRSWDFGTLDIGLMAASRTLHDPRYSKYVASVGDHFGWKLERTLYPANDFAIAQAFIEVYRSSHNEAQIALLRRQFDDAVALLNDPEKPAWWWCDALFMAPPAGSELSDITGDPTYDGYVDREWGETERLLYDKQKHLFSRDASYLNKHEKNGEKIFWSRGNGWVMAGLVRVLATLPDDDPLRPHYIAQLREMAAEVASVQGSDGLWRPGLLDAESYPQPEVSGSAFFTYAIAWGIDHRMLDAEIYLPVVDRAWAGLLTHVYADGRLGAIQPIGEAPGEYKASSSYNFGVGAFLLAGSELDVLSEHKHW